MNHRTNIDDSRDRRRRAHVARRPSKAHFRGSLWTVTRSRQNSRRHLRAAEQFRRGWCPQLMSSSCDWLMSEMFGRFPQPFRSMSTPEAFPYDPQLPRCLCTCETHPGAMHAHSAPGGGMGQGDPLASHLSPPPPPQVLFFGEFSHQLAPGQRPTEGGEVDEVCVSQATSRDWISQGSTEGQR